jgi:hypothetical protein
MEINQNTNTTFCFRLKLEAKIARGIIYCQKKFNFVAPQSEVTMKRKEYDDQETSS